MAAPVGGTLPSVSVIVPCYNVAGTIGRLVEALLAQDYPAEIIFVDDGSADGTAGMLRERAADHPAIRLLVHETNRGRASARNTGIAAATGDVLLFLDADMEPAPDFVRRHAEAHRNDSVIGLVSNPILEGLELDDPYHQYLAKRQGASGVGVGRPLPLKYFIIGYTSVKAEALRRVGGFDERFSYGEDIDFAYRLAQAFPDGLFFAERAIVHHHAHGDLDERLAKLWVFGRDNLPLLLAKHPGIAAAANLDFVPTPCGGRSLSGRAKSLVLSVPVAKVLRRLLPRIPEGARFVVLRYLMAATIAEAYRDSWHRRG